MQPEPELVLPFIDWKQAGWAIRLPILGTTPWGTQQYLRISVKPEFSAEWWCNGKNVVKARSMQELCQEIWHIWDEVMEVGDYKDEEHALSVISREIRESVQERLEKAQSTKQANDGIKNAKILDALSRVEFIDGDMTTRDFLSITESAMTAQRLGTLAGKFCRDNGIEVRKVKVEDEQWPVNMFPVTVMLAIIESGV